jgi:hypothetical protein
MADQFRLVRRTERLLIYEVQDVSVVSNEFVDSIPWPVEIPSLLLNFASEDQNDFKLLEKNFSGKYLSRLMYRAEKKELSSHVKEGLFPQIREYKFKTVAELQQLYLATEKMYFGEPWAKKLGYPWKQYLEGDYLKIIQINSEVHMPKAKVICFEKDDMPVAMMPLNTAKYFDGKDADCVSWVWISSVLLKAERREIRRRFVDWMKNQVSDHVVTGVNPFNAASNKFFKGIGFHTECLQITRPG